MKKFTAKLLTAVALIAIALTAALSAVCFAEETPATSRLVTYKDWATGETLGTETVPDGGTVSMRIGDKAYTVHNLIALALDTVQGMSVEQFGIKDDQIAVLDPAYRFWGQGSALQYEYYTIDGDVDKTASSAEGSTVIGDLLSQTDRFFDHITIDCQNYDVKVKHKIYVSFEELEQGVADYMPYCALIQASIYGSIEIIAEDNYRFSEKWGQYYLDRMPSIQGFADLEHGNFLKFEYTENFTPHQNNELKPQTIVCAQDANEFTVVYAVGAPAVLMADTVIYVDEIDHGGDFIPPIGGDPTPTDDVILGGFTTRQLIGLAIGCAVALILIVGLSAALIKSHARTKAQRRRAKGSNKRK